jgi:hypothetical protein
MRCVPVAIARGKRMVPYRHGGVRHRPLFYNIADDDGAVSIEKARAQLGFDPAFRIPLYAAR